LCYNYISEREQPQIKGADEMGKNFRFTDINGHWINIYDVPWSDEEGIDYNELGERESEEDFALIQDSIKEEEIDENGNLI
jgi:hypothetical protein